jgi:hypothetical protein
MSPLSEEEHARIVAIRAAQGLPPKVTDPVIRARIARVLWKARLRAIRDAAQLRDGNQPNQSPR